MNDRVAAKRANLRGNTSSALASRPVSMTSQPADASSKRNAAADAAA